MFTSWCKPCFPTTGQQTDSPLPYSQASLGWVSLLSNGTMRELRLPGSRLVRLAPYNTFFVLHRFVSLLQAHCSNGADAAMPGVGFTGSPLPGPFKEGGPGSPRFPGHPCMYLPCSRTPDGLPCQTILAFPYCPMIPNTKAPSIILISRLNHTAFTSAVYASCRHY
jgi:hypothetical protein